MCAYVCQREIVTETQSKCARTCVRVSVCVGVCVCMCSHTCVRDTTVSVRTLSCRHIHPATPPPTQVRCMNLTSREHQAVFQFGWCCDPAAFYRWRLWLPAPTHLVTLKCVNTKHKGMRVCVIKMQHDWFIWLTWRSCTTWLIHITGMTFTCDNSLIFIWPTRLRHVCAMTQAQVCHDSFICVTCCYEYVC